MKKRTRTPPLVDNVLICGKKKDVGQFTVWIVKEPGAQGQGETIAEAEKALVNKVWAEYQVDEPFAIKYQDDPGETGRLWQVSVNEVCDAADPAKYFTGGFCEICQSGQGIRNQKKLILNLLPRKVSSGFLVRFQPYFKCGMRVGMLVLHRDICEALELPCASVEFRSIMSGVRLSKDFFEVVARAPFRSVVPLSQKTKAGGVCSNCGSEFYYKINGSKMYVAAHDAASLRICGVGCIGNISNPALCVSDDMWQRLGKIESAQGLLKMPVFELPARDVNKAPTLEKIVRFKI